MKLGTPLHTRPHETRPSYGQLLAGQWCGSFNQRFSRSLGTGTWGRTAKSRNPRTSRAPHVNIERPRGPGRKDACTRCSLLPSHHSRARSLARFASMLLIHVLRLAVVLLSPVPRQIYQRKFLFVHAGTRQHICSDSPNLPPQFSPSKFVNSVIGKILRFCIQNPKPIYHLRADLFFCCCELRAMDFFG